MGGMMERADLFEDDRDPFSPTQLRKPERAPTAFAGTGFICLTVVGTPRPQGSKKAFVSKKTGRAFVVDDNSEKLSTWRQDVVGATVKLIKESGSDAFPVPPGVAISVTIAFQMPRPKGHWRSGKSTSHLLRDDAPAHPATKPDVDKLSRSTLDALRDAGAYVDDCQVVSLSVRKVWATDRPGAEIDLRW